jgi:septal ring factor EnvC (AmiA/AmiB activator)
MWPKLLFELLPHLSRLLPVADKYLGSKSAGDKARDEEQAAAMAELSEGLRLELGQVAEAHSGVYRQLREQSSQLTQVSVEVTRTRMGVESVEARLNQLEARSAKLEKTAASAVKLLASLLIVAALVAGMLILLAVLLLHR